jgi:uncharacterized protein (DUF885 family)
MSRKLILGLLVVAGLTVAFILNQSTPIAEKPAANSTADVQSVAESWDEFVHQVIEDYLTAHPAFAVAQGRHEFDGMLPDWSREGIMRETERLRKVKEAALSFADENLSAEQQYQRDYLVARTDRDLFWRDKANWPFKNPAFYFDWMSDSLDPAPYIALDYAPLAERMAAYSRFARNIVTAAAQIKANLAGPLPITYVNLGYDSFAGFAAFFENDMPAVFASVADEALQQEFSEANNAATAAMEDLAAHFEALRSTATDEFALGSELFTQMIYDTERVDVSLEELEAIGWADLKRNQAALADACNEFLPGEPIVDCFAKMADRKAPGGAVEGARVQLGELREFLVEQDLVTIPGTEVALVAESPPYARSNSAYINIPGPFENNQPSVYNISPPDPRWSEEEQQDYIPGEADLLFTSVHEVWPGHFLNFLHANRAQWSFGQVFVNYAFGEGWAHYTEEMMVEAGLRNRSPEVRIGQLSNALLRNCRYLSAIGLHTQGMTVSESEQFFVDDCFQAVGTARQQASRGTYDPAYLNYTMGKLMIRQLREDWTANRGGRAAWHDFHDTFLSFGGPPIPLVRGQMMNEAARAVFPVSIN